MKPRVKGGLTRTMSQGAASFGQKITRPSAENPINASVVETKSYTLPTMTANSKYIVHYVKETKTIHVYTIENGSRSACSKLMNIQDCLEIHFLPEFNDKMLLFTTKDGVELVEDITKATFTPVKLNSVIGSGRCLKVCPVGPELRFGLIYQDAIYIYTLDIRTKKAFPLMTLGSRTWSSNEVHYQWFEFIDSNTIYCAHRKKNEGTSKSDDSVTITFAKYSMKDNTTSSHELKWKSSEVGATRDILPSFALNPLDPNQIAVGFGTTLRVFNFESHERSIYFNLRNTVTGVSWSPCGCNIGVVYLENDGKENVMVLEKVSTTNWREVIE